MRAFRHAGTCVVVAIITALQLAPASAQPVPDSSGDDLVDRLAGHTISYETGRGDRVTQYLRIDGVAFIEVRRPDGSTKYDAGEWRLEGDMLCRTWQHLRNNRDNCISIRIDGDTVSLQSRAGGRAVEPVAGDRFDLAARKRGTDPNARQREKPQLIYISANDCGSCRYWNQTVLPRFRKTPEFAAIEFRKIDVWYFNQIRTEQSWPADLEWLRKRLRANGGTPRWFLVHGKRVVAHARGRSAWDREMVPQLQALIGKPDG